MEEQRARDHALNEVTGRRFADPDDDTAIRELIGAPLPAGTVGLLEAGWLLVPLLRVRSGTPVAAAAEARLAAIVGMLGSHRLRPEDREALATLDRHRRAAGRSQRSTDLGAAVVVAILLAALGALVLWLASLAGTAFLIGTAVAIPVLIGVSFLVIRRMDADDTAPHRVRIHGLEVSDWLAEALPPAHATAVDLALRVTPSPFRTWSFEPVVVVAGGGRTAVRTRADVLTDVGALAEPTVEAVLDLLRGYRDAADGRGMVAADVPRPPWAGRWHDAWEVLADELTGDAVEWTQLGGVLLGFVPGGGLIAVDLAAVADGAPDDRPGADAAFAAVVSAALRDPDSRIARLLDGDDGDRRRVIDALLRAESDH